MFTGRHLSMDIMANVDVSQHATPILILQVTCRVFCIFIQIPERRMTNYYYRPQQSCGQGYVFTRVCDSVHRGRGSPGTTPPPGTRQTPPRTRQTPPQDQADPPRPGRPPRTRQTLPDQADTPQTRQTTPPRPGRQPPGPGRPPPRTRQTPPPREEDCSIRSMSGRYASYWNAFLFKINAYPF